MHEGLEECATLLLNARVLRGFWIVLWPSTATHVSPADHISLFPDDGLARWGGLY